MKCSLLSLSTYIDGELSPDRRAELDAHMVGCPRCSAGASTLREEKLRISQLARVRVPSPSAQLMLEQVGITGVTALRQPQRPVVQEAVSHDLPWQDSTRRAAALPWAPTRPVVAPPAAAAATALPVESPQLQPGLPLDEDPVAPATALEAAPVAAAPLSEQAEPAADSEVAVAAPAPDPVELEVPLAATVDAGPAFEEIAAYAETVALEEPLRDHAAEVWTPLHGAESDDVEVAGLRQQSAPGDTEPLAPAAPPIAEESVAAAASEPPPAASWETTLPAPLDEVDASPPSWTAAPDDVAPPAAATPALTTPPQRVASAGAGAVWTRLRDAVAVRFALASGREVTDGGVEIVTGPAPRRQDTISERIAAVDEPVAAVPEPETPAAAAATPTWDSAAIGEVVPPVAAITHEEPEPARGRPSWNAFAASSYDDASEERTPVPGDRPLGRHSRAVARDTPSVGARVSTLLAAMTGAIASAAARVPVGRIRASAARGMARVPRGARPVIPRRVMTFGIPAVVVVFLLVLLVGHVSTPSPRVSTVTASLSPTQGAVQPTAPSAPAATAPAASSAPAATSAPAPATAQTFGGGGSGFQVERIRYGQQPGFFRTVFDIGAVSGAVTGTPRVTLSMPDPKTILLTFSGTAPAGSTGSPGGSTISSVTLVSSAGGNVQYRITLSQPATPNAFYLEGPTRFVLDLR